uniref:Uncharacterized protein n=1 Tax=Podoviridae sp. ctG4L18 TaxID=2825234 RepID=A0A8S5UPE5_9CAUD|nr:MAG TPA: hypothetical protein [Podoviridae sp. ctG4L18]
MSSFFGLIYEFLISAIISHFRILPLQKLLQT